MDRKTSPSGVRDGGTERPFVTERCVPGLSMRVPDALAFHPVTSLKDAGRSPRLRTTSNTGGSLQGRCDKTAAAGLGPCETLPNSVSGKDTDPAGRPLYSRTNAKTDPEMGSGTKGLGNAQINFFCHSAQARRAQMRKAERLYASDELARNLSTFRVRCAPRNDRNNRRANLCPMSYRRDPQVARYKCLAGSAKNVFYGSRRQA